MKIKKMMALVTAAAMAFGLAGCGGGNTAATTAAPTEKAEGTTAAEAVTEATEAAKSEGSDNWKVAILTGTVSQGEEEQKKHWLHMDRSTSLQQLIQTTLCQRWRPPYPRSYLSHLIRM